MSFRSGWILLLALFVTACSPTAPRRAGGIEGDPVLVAAQQQREAKLAAIQGWRLSGRIAVSHGKEGGSGRLDWTQDGDRLEVRLRAPVTRQGWRLLAEPDFARIEGLEGGPQQDADVDALLQRTVGWDIPLASLRAWARGARAQGGAQIEFNADGLPMVIVQQGWRIEYRAWQNGTLPLPLRVFASRGEQRVRLQIDAWQINPAP